MNRALTLQGKNNETRQKPPHQGYLVFILSFLIFFTLSSPIFFHLHLQAYDDQQRYDYPTSLKHQFVNYSSVNIQEYHNSSHIEFSDQLQTRKQPGIVWLLSFPNSGTSYTMNLVHDSSNLAVATNYGKESMINNEKRGDSVPILEQSPNGPFFVESTRLLPQKYIITKTHCDRAYRCMECPSKAYFIKNLQLFMNSCALGEKRVESKIITKQYDLDLIKKAIHIIRNPFDNIVSNFHLNNELNERHGHKKGIMPNTKEGFRDWCKRKEKVNIKDMMNHKEISKIIKSFTGKVPCIDNVFKYVQWHKYALKTTKHLNLPTLYIEYENYANNFNETIHKLFQFLDLGTDVKPATLFHQGKTYTDEYWTDEERSHTLEFIESMIETKEEFNLMKSYFPDNFQKWRLK